MGSISNDSNKNVYSGKSWVDAGVFIKTRTEACDKNSWEDRIGRRLSRMIKERDAAIAYEDAHTVDKRTKRYKEQQEQQEMGMGR